MLLLWLRLRPRLWTLRPRSRTLLLWLWLGTLRPRDRSLLLWLLLLWTLRKAWEMGLRPVLLLRLLRSWPLNLLTRRWRRRRLGGRFVRTTRGVG